MADIDLNVDGVPAGLATILATATAPAVLRKRQHIILAGADARNADHADDIFTGVESTGGDEAIIHTALASLPAGGGTVEIVGLAYTSTAIDAHDIDNVRIIGHGPGDRAESALSDTTALGTTIRAADNFSDDYMLEVLHTGGARCIEGLHLDGLTFDGRGLADNGVYASVYHSRVYNIRVSRTLGIGLHVEGIGPSGWGTYDCQAGGLQLDRNGGAGIKLGVRAIDWQIESIVSLWNQDGILFDGPGGAGHQFGMVHCYGNSRNSIRIRDGSGTNTQISQLKAEQSGEHNLYLESTASGGVGVLSIGMARLKNSGRATNNTYDAINTVVATNQVGPVQIGTLHIMDNGVAVVSAGTGEWSGTGVARYGINFAGALVRDWKIGTLLWSGTEPVTGRFNNLNTPQRVVINGLSRNNGDPTTTGEWNGKTEEGVRVWDRSGGASGFWTYAGGAWRAG